MLRERETYPGSKWWKIDFHVHTPASNDYKKKDVTEEELLKAAMEANLDCLVITDHNSGNWIDRLKCKMEGGQDAFDKRYKRVSLGG